MKAVTIFLCTMVLSAFAYAQQPKIHPVFQNYPLEKHKLGYCNYDLFQRYIYRLSIPESLVPEKIQHVSCWWATSKYITVLEEGDVYFQDEELPGSTCEELDVEQAKRGTWKGNIHKNGMQTKRLHYLMLDQGDYTIRICLPPENQAHFVVYFVGGASTLDTTSTHGTIFNAGGDIWYAEIIQDPNWSLFSILPQASTQEYAWTKSSFGLGPLH